MNGNNAGSKEQESQSELSTTNLLNQCVPSFYTPFVFHLYKERLFGSIGLYQEKNTMGSSKPWQCKIGVDSSPGVILKVLAAGRYPTKCIEYQHINVKVVC